MKVRILASDDMFIPESFDDVDIDDIVENIRQKVLDKYGRRFKRISVDIDDISWNDTRFRCEVSIFNGDRLVSQKYFDFTQYDDYFDESDYSSHFNREIISFVENLV